MAHKRTDLSRPNVVFIFADDWGWGDLGCYGHPHPGIGARLSNSVLGWQATLPDGPFDADAGSNAYPWPGRATDV